MDKKIYLYGEIHGSEIVNIKEFEIWKDFYNRGFRHLFMELQYFYAGLLNRWMKSETNEIPDILFASKTVGNSDFDRIFFVKIKEYCPETVFHGTDIGHQFETIGTSYLNSLSPDSEEYRLTLENIEQGRKYYEAWQKNIDEDYIEANREKAMTENFIREFDSVNSDIVGFYGESHIFSEGSGTFGMDENMHSMIKKHYSDNTVIIADYIKNSLEPIYNSVINLHGKIYDASCFGDIYTPFDEECEYIRIFRINEPGSEFKNYPKKENFIPEALYPIYINEGDVFIIDSINGGETFLRQIFICNDFSEEYGKITTEIDSEAL